MYFKQTTTSEVIFHDFGDDEKVLIPDEAHRVTLKGLPDEEIDGTGSFRRGLFTVTVEWELKPTRRVLPMFESLARFCLPADSTRTSDDEKYFDERGCFREEFKPKGTSRFILKLQILPYPMQVFIAEKVDELINFTNNFIKVLRWRTNVSGPFQMPPPGQFEWSIDNKEWHLMPQSMEGRELEWADILSVNDIQNDLSEFYKERIEAPLGHELFYEAWSLRHDSPRSSLMLGITSLEVGLKECIAILAPDTEWLMSNMPSPSVEKLLAEYLPTLKAKQTINGSVLAPPEKIMAEIRKGVKLRNDLVHRGDSPLKYETLRDILLAVKDVVFLCNFYMGFAWSWRHIRRSTRLILDPNAPVEELRVESPLL
jgi:hypothetical protein